MSAPRQRVKAAIQRIGRRLGLDVLPRSFYSPIPALDELPPGTLDARSPLAGIDLDLDRCEARLRELRAHLPEFSPPDGFGWDNRMYGRVEADVLHAVVRHHRPARVVELGSGFSSLIIAAALDANRAEGGDGAHTVFDPYPRDFLRAAGAAGRLSLTEAGAVDVPLAQFDALRSGDVLFVDTTHTVKVGGDVNRIVLDVLPRLAEGVVVHFHDVFLPYEYPREFFDKGLFWAEQYLLQAYLADNPGYEIELPLYALVRDRPEAVAELVPSYRPGCGPGAFWIRRVRA